MDMQEFNRLLSEADAYNTKINTALNVAVARNAGKEPLHSDLLACHKENDACGKKHAAIAQWGRDHEKAFHPDAPPELPPIEIPGMPPAGTIVGIGDRFKVPVLEVSNHVQVRGPCRPSIAVADGKQVVFGYSANPDEFVEGQASQSSGAAMVLVPAGVWYLNWKLSPGMGGHAAGDISVY